MKLIDLLQHTRVDEAPLGDYQTVGDWGDQEQEDHSAPGNTTSSMSSISTS